MLLLLLACDPWARWPDERAVFPWVHEEPTNLEPYESVRWETETWELTDPAMLGPYLLKTQLHRKGATDDVLAHHALLRPTLPPLVPTDLRLMFIGDVMWIRERWSDYGAAVQSRLDGDLRVGNLETPTDPDQPGFGELPDINSFNAPPALITGVDVDVWQVTNNHTLDVGDAGAEATLAEVARAGKVATGIDAHAVVDVGGARVALLAYTWGVNQRPAVTTHDLHIIPFGHEGEEIDVSRVGADIASADADLHVVLVHWGWEYEYYADPHFLRLGRELIRQGADLVVGHGPHVVQPAELCHVNQPAIVPGVGTCSIRTEDGLPRTAAVLYSLGDFAATPSLVTLPTKVGIIGAASLDPELGVTGLGWDPVASVDADGGQVVLPASEVMDDPAWAAEVARLEALLGAGWRRDP